MAAVAMQRIQNVSGSAAPVLHEIEKRLNDVQRRASELFEKRCQILGQDLMTGSGRSSNWRTRIANTSSTLVCWFTSEAGGTNGYARSNPGPCELYYREIRRRGANRVDAIRIERGIATIQSATNDKSR